MQRRDRSSLTPLERLRQRFTGASVDLVGNGPTALQWRPDASRLVVTVNSGLKLLAEHEARADLYWVQDERFIQTKAESIIPYLSGVDFFAANDRIIDQARPADYRERVAVSMLGYRGFSTDPGIGVFHGYNVIFGALQILTWCRVRRIDLYGVGLRYFSTGTRFDQAQRGFDVDLHRSSDQVVLLQAGIERARVYGIEVAVHGPSALINSLSAEPVY